jgi:hypothetical protein
MILTMATIMRVIAPHFTARHTEAIQQAKDAISESVAQRVRSERDMARYRQCIIEANAIKARIKCSRNP